MGVIWVFEGLMEGGRVSREGSIFLGGVGGIGKFWNLVFFRGCGSVNYGVFVRKVL